MRTLQTLEDHLSQIFCAPEGYSVRLSLRAALRAAYRQGQEDRTAVLERWLVQNEEWLKEHARDKSRDMTRRRAAGRRASWIAGLRFNFLRDMRALELEGGKC